MTEKATPTSQSLPVSGPRRPDDRGIWGLSPSDARSTLTGARNALLVMVGCLAFLWIVQIINWADQYRLTVEFGIRPRDPASLPDLLTAPFLHLSWAHIEGNSGPLFIFGFLAAFRGIAKFAGVTVCVLLTSGLTAWLTDPPLSIGVGASGIVFGYFGYIMVRGLFDRRLVDTVIGAVMALCFAYQFTVLLPHTNIGWQAHLGGLAGGVLAGWIFRDRRGRKGSRNGRTPVAVARPGQ